MREQSSHVSPVRSDSAVLLFLVLLMSEFITSNLMHPIAWVNQGLSKKGYRLEFCPRQNETPSLQIALTLQYSWNSSPPDAQ
ncbi:hypothetical protein BGW80DRAFT_519736 [Lactifluus volemus]|nr:hypothetical protein BGW80DRAFT_519736 [Lactifluus volemus]